MPYQNSCRCGTESADGPEYAFHLLLSFRSNTLLLHDKCLPELLDARRDRLVHVSESIVDESDHWLKMVGLEILPPGDLRAIARAGTSGFRRAEAAGYTASMDRVRFGRALGFGARQAMKTLATAVDAATAENPSAAKPVPTQPSRRTVSSAAASGSAAVVSTGNAGDAPRQDAAAQRTAQSTAKTVGQAWSQSNSQAREAKKKLRRGGKRFGEATWEPLVRLSGVLWLEVTGAFFGLFALVSLGYLWKLRGAWRANTADAASRHSLIGAAIMFVLFGYFCVSSFLRARRRERKR
jgi:hypothetical protein